jgi:hypothetical protein
MKEKAIADTQPTDQEPSTEYFKTYFEYNKVLRTWFVAFGVGGPALFLVNEKVAERLAQFGLLREVAALFLIGAAAQIAGALLNKVTNWYSYIVEYAPEYRGTWRLSFSRWYGHQFWIDILIDLTTIVCFGLAAWRLLTIFAR